MACWQLRCVAALVSSHYNFKLLPTCVWESLWCFTQVFDGYGNVPFVTINAVTSECWQCRKPFLFNVTGGAVQDDDAEIEFVHLENNGESQNSKLGSSESIKSTSDVKEFPTEDNMKPLSEGDSSEIQLLETQVTIQNSNNAEGCLIVESDMLKRQSMCPTNALSLGEQPFQEIY